MPTRPEALGCHPHTAFEPRGLGRTHRLQPEPVPLLSRRRKVAGKVAFVALLLLAVITGSLAGLMLVYSVDLPQINDLERYRPSTTTDLYDRKGPHHRLLCPRAACGRQLRRLCAGPAPGRHLH